MPERRVRLTINSPVKICSAVANDLSAAAGGVGGHAHLTQRPRARGISSCAPHSLQRISFFELPVERRKGGRIVRLTRTTSGFVFTLLVNCVPRRRSCRLAKSLRAKWIPGFRD